jgi:hypothetical protein
LLVSFASLVFVPAPPYVGMCCKLAAMAVIGLSNGLKLARLQAAAIVTGDTGTSGRARAIGSGAL